MSPLRTKALATAMLEGSFIALLWISALAFITHDHTYRQFAYMALTAVSLTIAGILALPRHWLFEITDNSSFAPDPQPEAKAADATAPTENTPHHQASPAQLGGGAPTSNQDTDHGLRT